MSFHRICIAAALVIHALGATARSEDKPAEAAVTVESVAIEKVGNDTFFRASIRWPAEGVPGEYSAFVAKSLGHPVRRWLYAAWPADSLALIAQSRAAALIVLRLTFPAQTPGSASPSFTEPGAREGLPATAVFLGKLLETTPQEFLLRCPSADGRWRYLPVRIDFTKAAKAEGISREWLRAQADFMGSFEAPADQSFFAYARGRFLTRLGAALEPQPWRPNMVAGGGPERLYEVTTGALALQESLQLDRMRNPDADGGARDVPIEQIEGVTIESHPWKEMIGEKQPQIESIAGLVPEDQYYVRFTTARSLSDFLDFAEAWGGLVLGQMETGARDYGVKGKIENQICLKTSWLSKLLGPAVIESLVITGSDPYLREGSDFSVIFQLKSASVFEAAVNRYLEDARKNHADLKEGKEEYGGATIQTFTTTDQVVRCHRALLDEYYVYSNSPVAIRRIIDSHRGQRASLARSLDFIYMRTLYPLKAEAENGFIFLSDPFIRALVGPRTRIAEKRRLETVTSLEMVKNAALLYLWENPGAKVPPLEELYNRGYLDAKHIVTEPGDRIEWDPAAFVARSERYRRMGYLVPNIELVMEKVTAKEKADYERFRSGYQSYWRRYFDPVGMRITTGRDMALSVTILPLITNSEYDEMQQHFGGKAVPLEPEKREGPVVMRFAAHLNRESRVLREIQNVGLTMPDSSGPGIPRMARAAVEWIGERLEFWIEDSDAFLAAMRDEEFGKLFQVPIVVGVEVRNPLALMGFLARVVGFVQVSSPNTVVFEPTEPYKGSIFTRVGPAPDSWIVKEESGSGGDEAMLKNAAIYYGKVGRMLYVSTSLDTLHRIADAMPTSQPATGAAGDTEPVKTRPAAAPAGTGETGHMALRLDFGQAKKSRPALAYLLGQQVWEVEKTHLRNLWLVAHTVGLGPEAAAPPERVLGFAIESALGNAYRYDPVHDEIVGSKTGSLWNPTVSESLPEDSPLDRLLDNLGRIDSRLEFTKDGLRTDLTIRRTGK